MSSERYYTGLFVLHQVIQITVPTAAVDEMQNLLVGGFWA